MAMTSLIPTGNLLNFILVHRKQRKKRHPANEPHPHIKQIFSKCCCIQQNQQQQQKQQRQPQL